MICTYCASLILPREESDAGTVLSCTGCPFSVTMPHHRSPYESTDSGDRP